MLSKQKLRSTNIYLYFLPLKQQSAEKKGKQTCCERSDLPRFFSPLMFKHPLPSSSSARLYFWTLFALKWLYVQKIYKLQLLKSFYSWDNISHKGRFVRLNHCFFNAVKLGILLLTLRKNLMNKNKSCTLHCAQELVLHQIFIPTALLLMNDIYCRKQHF